MTGSLPNFRKDKDGFAPVANHKNFMAKKMPAPLEAYADVMIAEIGAGGGGPIEETTHEHDHIFIVLEGVITADLCGAKYEIASNESIYVEGELPHSIWNHGDTIAKVICVNV